MQQALARPAGAQDLLDQVEQPVAVGEHDAVELPALVFGEFAALQRFEVEPNRGDRRLQFVRDGVDESVVLLVAPDFTHEKNRVEDQPADDDQEEDDAEDEQHPGTPVDDDPTDVERDGQGDQARAEDDEDQALASGPRDHGASISDGRRATS